MKNPGRTRRRAVRRRGGQDRGTQKDGAKPRRGGVSRHDGGKRRTARAGKITTEYISNLYRVNIKNSGMAGLGGAVSGVGWAESWCWVGCEGAVLGLFSERTDTIGWG